MLAVFLRGFLAVMAAEEILRGCGNAVGPALDEEGDVGFGVFSEELLSSFGGIGMVASFF